MDRAAFRRLTGFDLQERGREWEPLRSGIRAIVADKLNAVGWVPREAIAAVVGATSSTTPTGGIIVPLPIPSTFASGAPSPDRPAWLNTAEKRIWWDDFTAQVQRANEAFNQNQISVGRSAMEAAYRNSTLWNAAYQIARVVGAPVRLVEEAATSFFKSNVFLLLAVGGIGYYLLVHHRPPARKALR